MINFKRSKNSRYLVTKTKWSYLGPPYSQCSHYRRETQRPFNTLSHMQCYRHCLRIFAENNTRLNCAPLFIDDMITELDFFTEQNVFCEYEKRTFFDELVIKDGISKKCHDLCPNDCLTVGYSLIIQINCFGNGFIVWNE